MVNGLKLDGAWDIDHICVGPGGMLVVETKWSTSPWPLEHGQSFMEDSRSRAETQCRRNARDLAGWLAAAGINIPVASVVVLHGKREEGDAGWRKSPSAKTVVVHGAYLAQWLRTLPDTGVARITIDQTFALLAEQVAKRDAEDAETAAEIPTLWQFFLGWMIMPLLGATAAIYSFTFIVADHDWRIEIPRFVVALVLGLLATQWRPIRRATLGWTAAFTGMVLIGVGLLTASIF